MFDELKQHDYHDRFNFKQYWFEIRIKEFRFEKISFSLTVTLSFCCCMNEQRSERFIESFDNELYKIE